MSNAANFTCEDIIKLSANGFDVSFMHVYGNEVGMCCYYVRGGRNVRVYTGDNFTHLMYAADAYLLSLEC